MLYVKTYQKFEYRAILLLALKSFDFVVFWLSLASLKQLSHHSMLTIQVPFRLLKARFSWTPKHIEVNWYSIKEALDNHVIFFFHKLYHNFSL